MVDRISIVKFLTHVNVELATLRDIHVPFYLYDSKMLPQRVFTMRFYEVSVPFMMEIWVSLRKLEDRILLFYLKF